MSVVQSETAGIAASGTNVVTYDGSMPSPFTVKHQTSSRSGAEAPSGALQPAASASLTSANQTRPAP